jgi:excisionase family DNA binding protein
MQVTDTQREKIIPIARAARIAGIETHTLRRLIRKGLCTAVRVGRIRRVRLSDVLACLTELPASAV